MIKNVIALYPGRFQLFGKHHATAFKWLEKQFGAANCYIVTSNVVQLPKSPFSFKEKKDIIGHYDLDDRLVQVKNPYKSEEILSKLNPEDTAVVFMVGAKDMKEDPRFKIGKKKDGSDSYFQEYERNKRNLQGFDKHGYLVIAPHVSITIPGYGELSGTSLRKALGAKTPRSQKINLFKAAFGWYDQKTANMIFDKLEPMNESKIFSIDWWNKNLFLNEAALTPNVWKDFNLSSLKDDDMTILWDMYTSTYSKQGLDFSASDFKELQNKYKAVYLEDVDGDSIADAFIVYKATPYGNRISLLGTNDKKEAKKELLSKVFKLLKTKGWFIEASKKMEEILAAKSDIPVIRDEKIIQYIAGDKGLEMMEDGYYKRKLSKIDKTIVKRMYGTPNNSAMTEGSMSPEQLKKHNSKIKSLQSFLDANIGKPFEYDFNKFPKTVFGVKMPTQESVNCEICNNPFRQITERHLKYKHNITLNEYVIKYPNSKLLAESLRKELRDNNSMKDKKNIKSSITLNELMYKIEIFDFKELLMCGGAGGHMHHPFNIEWVKTGDDLLKAFELSINYLKKGPASVKIDGVNASIRLITLNKQKTFVMDRGSNKPLDVKGITKAELEDRFGAGHGMIKVGGTVLDIFNESLDKIKPALQKLEIWDNPNIMFNIEYVAGSTNVLSYNKNFLAIHGLLEIQQVTPTKRATKEVSYNKKAMQDLLNNLVPAANKRGYEILGSIPTTLDSDPNLSVELNKKYTVNYGTKKVTKTLAQWLSEAEVPTTTIKTKEGKTIDALSKDVLIKISDGIALPDYIADPKDYKAAVDGFVIYMATMKLGDAVLSSLSSPLGPVSEHEGIVIRDPKISKSPFKITGKFILGGLATSFRK
jgi:hypothetical protein